MRIVCSTRERFEFEHDLVILFLPGFVFGLVQVEPVSPARVTSPYLVFVILHVPYHQYPWSGTVAKKVLASKL